MVSAGRTGRCRDAIASIGADLVRCSEQPFLAGEVVDDECRIDVGLLCD
jgi:hypothetical protein